MTFVEGYSIRAVIKDKGIILYKSGLKGINLNEEQGITKDEFIFFQT